MFTEKLGKFEYDGKVTGGACSSKRCISGVGFWSILLRDASLSIGTDDCLVE